MTSPAPPDRIVIQHPLPAVEAGRFAVKRCIGDPVSVSADIFRDGHDKLRAVARYRPVEAGAQWRETPLRAIDAHHDGVRWAGEFTVDRIGPWEYVIEAWTDRFGTWRNELERKLAAGQHELGGELSEGRLLLQHALESAAEAADRELIQRAVEATGGAGDAETLMAVASSTMLGLGSSLAPAGATLQGAAVTAAVQAREDYALLLSAELEDAMARADPRDLKTTFGPLPVRVDRQRARFSSWYELFPRSWGGLKGVERQLPRLAELGFDVIYLPPIHPIGHTNRKGANNSVTAKPGEPGSPWAIGDETGGHDTVHRELGTEADLRSLAASARELGIDIALDFAIQCSADHPWLTEHPEWFNRRPDGTLKYAENPPKRYQDIYNVNWDCEDWQGLWQALLQVVLHWVGCGIKVFRVDNPHTKPAPFWEWLIAEVQARDPEVLFLAEAFTKRAMMRHLAKLGFSQSYTYFTWKNSRWELTEYVSELALTDECDYFRPNFFANTPDILHAYLQHGGRPAFEARAVLAATLSPSYGIYSGFENCESEPVRAGSEEYLDSEKYEIKQRKLDGPLLPLLQRLNLARRENPALQHLDNICFLETENDQLLAYAKRTGHNIVIAVVNLDPHEAQTGVAVVPARLDTPPSFPALDLLTGEEFKWRLGRNYVRLEPGQSHLLRLAR